MMLMIDRSGQLAVYGENQLTVLQVNSLSELHRAMEQHNVSFISPTIIDNRKYISDPALLTIIDQFHVERVQLMIQAMFRTREPMTC
jgi:hypothetical protein